MDTEPAAAAAAATGTTATKGVSPHDKFCMYSRGRNQCHPFTTNKFGRILNDCCLVHCILMYGVSEFNSLTLTESCHVVSLIKTPLDRHIIPHPIPILVRILHMMTSSVFNIESCLPFSSDFA